MMKMLMATLTLLACGSCAGPPQQKPRVFIFGLGYTGAATGRALAGHGCDVVGTCRRASLASAAQGAGGVRTVAFDEDGLSADGREALEGATHVLSTIPPGASGDPVLEHAGALLEESIRSGQLRWVGYLSTTSVYGHHQGAWVDETSPTRAPEGSTSHARLGVEASWSALAAGHDSAAVAIFRLAGIYGPGRSALDTLRRQGIDGATGAGAGNPTSRVHVEDIAGAVAAALRARCSGVYNVADLRPAPRAEVMRFCAAELLQLGGGASPATPPAPDAPPRGSERSRRRGAESKRVDGGKLRRQLGYEYAHPDYVSGLTAIAERERRPQTL
jgi:nucleoside-diphosphate-sugar epimerase